MLRPVFGFGIAGPQRTIRRTSRAVSDSHEAEEGDGAKHRLRPSSIFRGCESVEGQIGRHIGWNPHGFGILLVGFLRDAQKLPRVSETHGQRNRNGNDEFPGGRTTLRSVVPRQFGLKTCHVSCVCAELHRDQMHRNA